MAKNRTANPIKPVSKPENESFHPYFCSGTFVRLKLNLQSAKHSTANAVKLVSKPANQRFSPYLGSGSFDRLKIIFKVLKIEMQLP